ncbi:DUF6328 family protein [Duganella vulcania]|uniref:DUF6328 family protein n=1 Tax=Duganella vulcania TaxID=2692166 RepID=UPI0020C1D16D|nr:DUF6328 family protein [Duganella vulcania]
MTPPEPNSLKEQLRNIIEEARMVLPGIQALFGFQTVAVFNQRFDALPAAVQAVHLLALATVVIAIALIMTPAAWHRIVSPQRVSESIVKLSSRMICAALLPLAVGLALDMFVVFYVVSSSVAAGTAAAVLSLALLLTLWFALPLRERRRRR